MVINEFKVQIILSANPSLASEEAINEVSGRISKALDDINFTQIIRQKFDEYKIGGVKIEVTE